MSPDYKNFTAVKFNPLTYLHIYHSVVSISDSWITREVRCSSVTRDTVPAHTAGIHTHTQIDLSGKITSELASLLQFQTHCTVAPKNCL